jgi:flagellar biosynthetic protein FliR
MTGAVVAFDPFAPGSVATLALFGARVSGLMIMAPVFSSTVIPREVRVALLVTLTVLLAPVALASATTSARGVPALSAPAFLSEVLIGMAIGFGAALMVGAAEAAGDVMAVQIGLSGAAILDPINNSQVPILGSFMQLFAIALLLSLDLHLGMLQALADSTSALPVGVPVDVTQGVGAMLKLAGALFAFGARFAAPVIAVVLIANVALAVLGRAAPQLNVLTVSFPVQITLGLMSLVAALPAIGRFFTGWRGISDGMLTTIVHGFTAVATH